jgi:uncharacterized repeat protein (TIGR03803 family)
MIRFVYGFLQKYLLLSSLFLGIFSFSAMAALPPEFELLYSLGKTDGQPSSEIVHDNLGNHYGVISKGGANGYGAFYKIDASGNYSVLYSFDGVNGYPAFGKLTLGGANKFYGVTSNSSTDNTLNNSVIYQLDISGDSPVFSVLYKSEVDEYISDLIVTRDGMLLGSNHRGKFFQINPNTATPELTVLYNTSGFPSSSPTSLLEGIDGKIYGVVWTSTNSFAVFRLDKSTASPIYEVLYSFPRATGTPPRIIQTKDSQFYGSINYRNRGDGTRSELFKVDLLASVATYTLLYASDSGSRFEGGLVAVSNTQLYSIFDRSVFQLDVSGQVPKFTLLNTTDLAWFPEAGLSQDDDGNLYGSAASGVAGGNRLLFKLDVAGSSPVYSVLHTFENTHGKLPEASLIEGCDGLLYGTTSRGGEGAYGTVFKFDVSQKTPKYHELFAFNLGNGGSPETNLLRGADGKLYGTTAFGAGENGGGTLFQLDISKANPIHKILHQFDLINGYHPSADFIRGSDGKFYGTTAFGSAPATSGGTIFQFDPSGAMPKYNLMYGFNRTDGITPMGLMQGRDGKFYGTTYQSANGGVLYQFDALAVAPSLRVLHEFLNPGGSALPTSMGDPIAGLMQAKNGKFYGTTTRGGRFGRGTIFSLDTSVINPEPVIVHEFDYNNGQDPRGGLIQANDGKLYGATTGGGSTNQGVVYQLDISGVLPVFKVIHAFNGRDGANPVRDLIQASDGNLYGVTKAGGTFSANFDDGGVIYRIKLDNTPVNTAPTAVNDSYVFKMRKSNKPVSIAAPGVLKNDKDGEGDKLTVVGAMARKPRVIVLPKGAGKVSLYPNGRLVYERGKKCFFGSQSFTYRVTDGKAISNPARVTLTIRYR